MVSLGVVLGSLMATAPREMTVPSTYVCQFLFARAEFQTQFHNRKHLASLNKTRDLPPSLNNVLRKCLASKRIQVTEYKLLFHKHKGVKY